MHAIRSFSGGSPVTDDKVAAYVAKYVGKSVSEAGGSDYPITSAAEIPYAAANAHMRALMGTCWRLGGLAELQALRLRAWTHTLGYRGHVLTKSRAYSTTYAALRADRAEHRRGGAELGQGVDTVTDADWRYVGSGHSPGAALIAAGIAEDLAEARRYFSEMKQRGSGGDSEGA